MNEDKKREEIARLQRRNQEQFDMLCKEYDLTPEQRQHVIDGLEMNWLVTEEHAKDLARLLEQGGPKEVAALEILNLIRYEIHDSVWAILQALTQRIEALEERIVAVKAERKSV